MRPHVEVIHEDDLIWHPAELPRGDGMVRQRNLSYDEENGAASTRLEFDSAFSRPGGYHHSDTEWFVLEGEMSLGGERLGKGGYWRAPAGLRVPELEVKPGSKILVFREYGDMGFSVSDSDRSGDIPQGGNTASSEKGELTVVRSREMGWTPNIYEGDSQKFLNLKLLYRDPSPADDHEKGFVTLLGYAPPSWYDHKVAHHPCFEEAYTLWGDLRYNFGQTTPGTYFFRPARVKHGMFDANPQIGCLWLFRLDGDLINWVTQDPEVHVDGEAINYDPDNPYQRPVLAGLPVRSKQTGPWDGRGR